MPTPKSSGGYEPDETPVSVGEVITSEMLDAGVQCFEEWEVSEDASVRRLVASIYWAMRACI